jgi:predicted dehydrogenase
LPWRVIPEIAGGGRFVDLASHTLDFLDYTLGPIVEVQGWASNQAGKYRAEDMVTGTFRFASGVHGTGAWCFSAYDQSDVTEIVGNKGKISFSTFGAVPVKLITGMSVVEYAFEYPQHIAQPLIQTVVNELIGVGKCPSTGESAARTSWVMDRMLGS